MDFYKQRSTWWSGNCYHKEQLMAILDSPDVRAYAYICHDKCKNEKGENLKSHYHFLVQMTHEQRGSWFKAFNSEDMGIVFIEPTRSPIDAYKYLIHDTEKCRKEGKFLYPENERISTIEDFTGDEKDENENLELLNDISLRIDEKITWQEFIARKPKRIHMMSNIKTTYDLFYFERHGIRYFDKNTFYDRPHNFRPPTPPRLAPPAVPALPKTDKAVLTPIPPEDAESLPW